jgi:uncharacterized membrane protein
MLPASCGYVSSMAETPKEKTDRQLIELLNELRVALPGAQVLLGFLLTAPLASRFGRTSQFDRALLYVVMIVTTVGVLLLMAPSVHHRIRWTEGGKEDVIRVGHRLFLLGTGCLAVGLLCTALLIGDLIFGPTAAGVALGIVFVVVLATWYVLPLARSRNPEVRRRE